MDAIIVEMDTITSVVSPITDLTTTTTGSPIAIRRAILQRESLVGLIRRKHEREGRDPRGFDRKGTDVRGNSSYEQLEKAGWMNDGRS